MFDPNAAKGKKAAEAQKKKVLNELKEWATNIVPIELREGTTDCNLSSHKIVLEI